MINFAETVLNTSDINTHEDSTYVESSMLLSECADLFTKLNNVLYLEATAVIPVGVVQDKATSTDSNKSGFLTRVWVYIKKLFIKLFNYAMGFFSNKFRHAAYDTGSIRTMNFIKDMLQDINIFRDIMSIMRGDFLALNGSIFADMSQMERLLSKCDPKYIKDTTNEIRNIMEDKSALVAGIASGGYEVGEDEIKDLTTMAGSIHRKFVGIVKLDGLAETASFLPLVHVLNGMGVPGDKGSTKHTPVSTYYKDGVDNGITNDMNIMSNVKSLFESVSNHNIKKDILDEYANDIISLLNKNYRFKNDADLNIASKEFQYTDVNIICDNLIDAIPIDIMLLCTRQTKKEIQSENPEDGIIKKVMNTVTSNRQLNMIKEIKDINIEGITADKVNYAKLCVFAMKVITDNQKIIQTSLSIVTILNNCVYEYLFASMMLWTLDRSLLDRLQTGRVD